MHGIGNIMANSAWEYIGLRTVVRFNVCCSVSLIHEIMQEIIKDTFRNAVYIHVLCVCVKVRMHAVAYEPVEFCYYKL